MMKKPWSIGRAKEIPFSDGIRRAEALGSLNVSVTPGLFAPERNHHTPWDSNCPVTNPAQSRLAAGLAGLGCAILPN